MKVDVGISRPSSFLYTYTQCMRCIWKTLVLPSIPQECFSESGKKKSFSETIISHNKLCYAAMQEKVSYTIAPRIRTLGFKHLYAVVWVTFL